MRRMMRRSRAGEAAHRSAATSGVEATIQPKSRPKRPRRQTETSAGWAESSAAGGSLLRGRCWSFPHFRSPTFPGLSTKDYGLWYQVGLAVRQGLDIYPRPETGRLFPFMYPPSAAAMLAWVSMLGSLGSLLALVMVNSAAWLASIGCRSGWRSDLAKRRHPLVVILPSLSIIVLVHNIYLLGQPNLLAPGTPLGRICLPAAGRPSGPARSWRRPRPSRRFRSWSWAT